ncbi:MAG: outer membrane beta-barrel protein [candidate division Zixibacteria bacterium]|nr:outer membrane beta-barrel protein [candidate division Zixibacteria bacterium]
MRKLSLFCLLTIITYFLGCSAEAQDFSRKFTLGARGGIWKLGLTEHSDSNTVGNFGALYFRYNLREKIGLGFLATYAKTWEADLSGKRGGGAGFSFSKKDGANRSTQMWLELLLIYRFSPWEKLNPYVCGGAGMAFWNLKDRNGEYVQVLDKNGNPFDLKDQELTVSLGGGLEYRFKEKWGLDFGTRFRILSRILTDFKDSKDILSSGPGELDVPKATLELFLGVNYYFGKLMDTDKDGVSDRNDFCADTPYGAVVDERGCPLDSDGDGIYDGLDRCPNTPPKSDVDVNGCALQE